MSGYGLQFSDRKTSRNGKVYQIAAATREFWDTWQTQQAKLKSEGYSLLEDNKNAGNWNVFKWHNNQGQGGNFQQQIKKPAKGDNLRKHITIGQAWNLAIMSMTEAEKGATMNFDEVRRRMEEFYVRIMKNHDLIDNPKSKEPAGYEQLGGNVPLPEVTSQQPAEPPGFMEETPLPEEERLPF